MDGETRFENTEKVYFSADAAVDLEEFIISLLKRLLGRQWFQPEKSTVNLRFMEFYTLRAKFKNVTPK